MSTYEAAEALARAVRDTAGLVAFEANALHESFRRSSNDPEDDATWWDVINRLNSAHRTADQLFSLLQEINVIM